MRVLKRVVLLVVIVAAAFIAFLFIYKPKPIGVVLGVNFSQGFAQSLNGDWKANYIGLLKDLKVKNIKLGTNWDLLEPERGKFNWTDLDWQVKEAEKSGASLIVVVGMKTPRWPECHIPEWVKNLSRDEIGKEVVNLVSGIVGRYKSSPAVKIWQVENEPFFRFGECPSYSADFVKDEVRAVKSADKSRQVLITESGEFSTWTSAAKLGDIVGTTLYRKVWFSPLKFYFNYPFPPSFYYWKAWLIKKIFGKEVIDTELQAEPWTNLGFQKTPLEEQYRTFDLQQFRDNVEFARETALPQAYLWGAEWWWWMKNQGHPEYWDYAKELFKS